MGKRFVFRLFGFSLASIYLATNCVFAHKPQATMWEERRQFAQLPSQLRNASSDVFHRLPSAKSALSQKFQTSVQQKVVPALTPLIRSLPNAYGTVRKISVPEKHDGRAVLHIQDVHMNPEAQNNIRHVVKAAGIDGAVGLIAVEGTFAPVELGAFQKFSNQNAVSRVADYLLAQNKISGAVHAALTSGGSMPAVVGVDHRTHYDANIEAYRQSVSRVSELKSRLADVRNQISGDKKKIFNPALAVFDAQVEAYRRNEQSMPAFVSALVAAAEETTHSIDVFLEAVGLESKLDFARVEAERETVVRELVARLPSADASLVEASVAFRTGRVSTEEFYAFLRSLCRRYGVDLGRTPAMADYIQYVLLTGSINAETLLSDLARLEEKAYAKLASSAGEKKILAESKKTYLQGKLLDFALTPAEWSAYKTLMRSSGVAGNLNLDTFETFYREAEARDAAMADNFLKAMEKARVTTAVLVTGGFHTPGIDKILNERGVASVTFAPKISKVEAENGTAYLSVFTQEKTPLDKLFAGEKLFVSQHPAQIGGFPRLLNLVVEADDPNAPVAPSVKAELVETGLSEDVESKDIAEGESEVAADDGVIRGKFGPAPVRKLEEVRASRRGFYREGVKAAVAAMVAFGSVLATGRSEAGGRKNSKEKKKTREEIEKGEVESAAILFLSVIGSIAAWALVFWRHRGDKQKRFPTPIDPRHKSGRATLFVDEYELTASINDQGKISFSPKGSNSDELAGMFMGAVAVLADILPMSEKLNDYFNERLKSTDNRGPPIRIRVATDLRNNALRRHDAASGTVEIIFSEKFIRALLSAPTRYSTAVRMILAERLFHELGHSNTVGDTEQELAEEVRVVERDVQLNYLVRLANLQATIDAYFEQERPAFSSGRYFNNFIHDLLLGFVHESKTLRFFIERLLPTKFAEKFFPNEADASPISGGNPAIVFIDDETVVQVVSVDYLRQLNAPIKITGAFVVSESMNAGRRFVLIANRTEARNRPIDRDVVWVQRKELNDIIFGSGAQKTAVDRESKTLEVMTLLNQDKLGRGSSQEDVLRAFFLNSQRGFEEAVRRMQTGELHYDVDTYDLSANDYSHIRHFSWIYQQEIRELIKLLEADSERTVVLSDVGTGFGHFILTLAAVLPADYLSRVRFMGTDYKLRDLRFAGEATAEGKYERLNVQWHQSDINGKDFPRQLSGFNGGVKPDMIVVNHVLEHLEGKTVEGYILDWLRATGRTLVVTIPLEDSLENSVSSHTQEFSVARLEEIARSIVRISRGAVTADMSGIRGGMLIFRWNETGSLIKDSVDLFGWETVKDIVNGYLSVWGRDSYRYKWEIFEGRRFAPEEIFSTLMTIAGQANGGVEVAQELAQALRYAKGVTTDENIMSPISPQMLMRVAAEWIKAKQAAAARASGLAVENVGVALNLWAEWSTYIGFQRQAQTITGKSDVDSFDGVSPDRIVDYKRRHSGASDAVAADRLTQQARDEYEKADLLGVKNAFGLMAVHPRDIENILREGDWRALLRMAVEAQLYGEGRSHQIIRALMAVLVNSDVTPRFIKLVSLYVAAFQPGYRQASSVEDIDWKSLSDETERFLKDAAPVAIPENFNADEVVLIARQEKLRDAETRLLQIESNYALKESMDSAIDDYWVTPVQYYKTIMLDFLNDLDLVGTGGAVPSDVLAHFRKQLIRARHLADIVFPHDYFYQTGMREQVAEMKSRALHPRYQLYQMEAYAERMYYAAQLAFEDLTRGQIEVQGVPESYNRYFNFDERPLYIQEWVAQFGPRRPALFALKTQATIADNQPMLDIDAWMAQLLPEIISSGGNPALWGPVTTGYTERLRYLVIESGGVNGDVAKQIEQWVAANDLALLTNFVRNVNPYDVDSRITAGNRPLVTTGIHIHNVASDVLFETFVHMRELVWEEASRATLIGTTTSDVALAREEHRMALELGLSRIGLTNRQLLKAGQQNRIIPNTRQSLALESFYFTLDDDYVPSPLALQQLVPPMVDHPQIGFTQGPLFFRGTLEPGHSIGRRIDAALMQGWAENFGPAMNDLDGHHAPSDMLSWDNGARGSLPLPIGTVTLYRTTAGKNPLSRTGGFPVDPRKSVSGEDFYHGALAKLMRAHPYLFAEPQGTDEDGMYTGKVLVIGDGVDYFPGHLLQKQRWTLAGVQILLYVVIPHLFRARSLGHMNFKSLLMMLSILSGFAILGFIAFFSIAIMPLVSFTPLVVHFKGVQQFLAVAAIWVLLTIFASIYLQRLTPREVLGITVMMYYGTWMNFLYGTLLAASGPPGKNQQWFAFKGRRGSINLRIVQFAFALYLLFGAFAGIDAGAYVLGLLLLPSLAFLYLQFFHESAPRDQREKIRKMARDAQETWFKTFSRRVTYGWSTLGTSVQRSNARLVLNVWIAVAFFSVVMMLYWYIPWALRAPFLQVLPSAFFVFVASWFALQVTLSFWSVVRGIENRAIMKHFVPNPSPEKLGRRAAEVEESEKIIPGAIASPTNRALAKEKGLGAVGWREFRIGMKYYAPVVLAGLAWLLLALYNMGPLGPPMSWRLAFAVSVSALTALFALASRRIIYQQHFEHGVILPDLGNSKSQKKAVHEELTRRAAAVAWGTLMIGVLSAMAWVITVALFPDYRLAFVIGIFSSVFIYLGGHRHAVKNDASQGRKRPFVSSGLRGLSVFVLALLFLIPALVVSTVSFVNERIVQSSGQGTLHWHLDYHGPEDLGRFLKQLEQLRAKQGKVVVVMENASPSEDEISEMRPALAAALMDPLRRNDPDVLQELDALIDEASGSLAINIENVRKALGRGVSEKEFAKYPMILYFAKHPEITVIGERIPRESVLEGFDHFRAENTAAHELYNIGDKKAFFKAMRNFYLSQEVGYDLRDQEVAERIKKALAENPGAGVAVFRGWAHKRIVDMVGNEHGFAVAHSPAPKETHPPVDEVLHPLRDRLKKGEEIPAEAERKVLSHFPWNSLRVAFNFGPLPSQDGYERASRIINGLTDAELEELNDYLRKNLPVIKPEANRKERNDWLNELVRHNLHWLRSKNKLDAENLRLLQPIMKALGVAAVQNEPARKKLAGRRAFLRNITAGILAATLTVSAAPAQSPASNAIGVFPPYAASKAKDFLYFSYDDHDSKNHFDRRVPFVEAAIKNAEAGGAKKIVFWREDQMSLAELNGAVPEFLPLTRLPKERMGPLLKKMNFTASEWEQFSDFLITWSRVSSQHEAFIEFLKGPKTVSSLRLLLRFEKAMTPGAKPTPRHPFLKTLAEYADKKGYSFLFETNTPEMLQLDFLRVTYREIALQAFFKKDMAGYGKALSAMVESDIAWSRIRDEEFVRQMKEIKEKDPETAIVAFKGRNHQNDQEFFSKGDGWRVVGHSPKNGTFYNPAAQIVLAAKKGTLDDDKKWRLANLIFPYVFIQGVMIDHKEIPQDFFMNRIMNGQEIDSDDTPLKPLTAADGLAMLNYIADRYKADNPTGKDHSDYVGFVAIEWMKKNGHWLDSYDALITKNPAADQRKKSDGFEASVLRWAPYALGGLLIGLIGLHIYIFFKRRQAVKSASAAVNKPANQQAAKPSMKKEKRKKGPAGLIEWMWRNEFKVQERWIVVEGEPRRIQEVINTKIVFVWGPLAEALMYHGLLALISILTAVITVPVLTTPPSLGVNPVLALITFAYVTSNYVLSHLFGPIHGKTVIKGVKDDDGKLHLYLAPATKSDIRHISDGSHAFNLWVGLIIVLPLLWGSMQFLETVTTGGLISILIVGFDISVLVSWIRHGFWNLESTGDEKAAATVAWAPVVNRLRPEAKDPEAERRAAIRREVLGWFDHWPSLAEIDHETQRQARLSNLPQVVVQKVLSDVRHAFSFDTNYTHIKPYRYEAPVLNPNDWNAIPELNWWGLNKEEQIILAQLVQSAESGDPGANFAASGVIGDVLALERILTVLSAVEDLPLVFRRIIVFLSSHVRNEQEAAQSRKKQVKVKKEKEGNADRRRKSKRDREEQSRAQKIKAAQAPKPKSKPVVPGVRKDIGEILALARFSANGRRLSNGEAAKIVNVIYMKAMKGQGVGRLNPVIVPWVNGLSDTDLVLALSEKVQADIRDGAPNLLRSVEKAFEAEAAEKGGMTVYAVEKRAERMAALLARIKEAGNILRGSGSEANGELEVKTEEPDSKAGTNENSNGVARHNLLPIIILPLTWIHQLLFVLVLVVALLPNPFGETKSQAQTPQATAYIERLAKGDKMSAQERALTEISLAYWKTDEAMKLAEAQGKALRPVKSEKRPMADNAWSLLSGILAAQARHKGDVPMSADEIKFGLNLLSEFEDLVSPMGGLYKSAGDKSISVEDNATAITALESLRVAITIALENDPKDAEAIRNIARIRKLRDKIVDYFKFHAFDKKNGVFYKGHDFKYGKHIPSDEFSPSTQAWVIVTMMPERITEWYGKKTTYNMWKATKELAAYHGRKGELGVGSKKGHGVFDTRASAITVFALVKMADHYKDGDKTWRAELEADAKAIARTLANFRMNLAGNRHAYAESSNNLNTPDPAATIWVGFLEGRSGTPKGRLYIFDPSHAAGISKFPVIPISVYDPIPPEKKPVRPEPPKVEEKKDPPQPEIKPKKDKPAVVKREKKQPEGVLPSHIRFELTEGYSDHKTVGRFAKTIPPYLLNYKFLRFTVHPDAADDFPALSYFELELGRNDLGSYIATAQKDEERNWTVKVHFVGGGRTEEVKTKATVVENTQAESVTLTIPVEELDAFGFDDLDKIDLQTGQEGRSGGNLRNISSQVLVSAYNDLTDVSEEVFKPRETLSTNQWMWGIAFGVLGFLALIVLGGLWKLLKWFFSSKKSKGRGPGFGRKLLIIFICLLSWHLSASAGISQTVKSMQFLDASVNPDTGVAYSYKVPKGHWVKVRSNPKNVDATIDRLFTTFGGGLYDQANWQIAQSRWGTKASQTHADNQTAHLRRGTFVDMNTTRAHLDPFLYGDKKVRVAKRNAWYFRLMPADGVYTMEDPLNGATELEGFPNNKRLHWEDWKPIMGENAWIIMGVLQSANKKYEGKIPLDSDEMALAFDLFPTFELMVSPLGGVYHAPHGTAGVNPGAISVENNSSFLGTLDQMKKTLNRAKEHDPRGYEKSKGFLPRIEKMRENIRGYLKNHAFDKENNIFYQGHELRGGKLVPVKTFASDCQSWPVIVLTPKVVDEWFGKGTSYKIWQKTKELGAYKGEEGDLGVGFTRGHDVYAVEWSMGFVLSLSLSAEEYDKSEPKWAKSLRDDAKAIAKTARKFKVTHDDGSESYLYANKFVVIPFGWNGHRVSSLIATIWVGYIEGNPRKGFVFMYNPFTGEDTKIPVIPISTDEVVVPKKEEKKDPPKIEEKKKDPPLPPEVKRPDPPVVPNVKGKEKKQPVFGALPPAVRFELHGEYSGATWTGRFAEQIPGSLMRYKYLRFTFRPEASGDFKDFAGSHLDISQKRVSSYFATAKKNDDGTWGVKVTVVREKAEDFATEATAVANPDGETVTITIPVEELRRAGIEHPDKIDFQTGQRSIGDLNPRNIKGQIIVTAYNDPADIPEEKFKERPVFLSSSRGFWIAVALTGGVLGVLAFLWFLGGWYMKRMQKQGKGPGQGGRGKGLKGFLILFSLMGLPAALSAAPVTSPQPVMIKTIPAALPAQAVQEKAASASSEEDWRVDYVLSTLKGKQLNLGVALPYETGGDIIFVDNSLAATVKNLLLTVNAARTTVVVAETADIARALRKERANLGLGQIDVIDGSKGEIMDKNGWNLSKVEELARKQPAKYKAMAQLIAYDKPVSVVRSEESPEFIYTGLNEDSIFKRRGTIITFINKLLQIMGAATPTLEIKQKAERQALEAA